MRQPAWANLIVKCRSTGKYGKIAYWLHSRDNDSYADMPTNGKHFVCVDRA
jgi:hypothetical protein